MAGGSATITSSALMCTNPGFQVFVAALRRVKTSFGDIRHTAGRSSSMWTYRGLRLWMFFSIAASVVLASQCSPIDPGAAGQLPAAVAAPTSVHSAVQYAVLTAKQRSSECIPVGGDVLRGLLLHVAFNSCLGFPGEGPPKRFGRPLLCHWQAAD